MFRSVDFPEPDGPNSEKFGGFHLKRNIPKRVDRRVLASKITLADLRKFDHGVGPFSLSREISPKTIRSSGDRPFLISVKEASRVPIVTLRLIGPLAASI